MEQEDQKMLSLCFAGGNLGAALFNTYSGKLELLRDIPDFSPGYEMLTSLVYLVKPDIILVSARQDDRSGDGGGGQCISLMMIPSMEFGLSSCLRRVNRMEVPGKPSTCDQEPLVKLSAFVHFSCTSLVRAASSEIVGQ